jgi:hypothetical protein
MSIMGAAWLVYGVMALLFVRPLAGHFAWSMWRNYCVEYAVLVRGRKTPTGEQWFGATLIGIATAAIWPATLLFVVVGWRGPVIGAEKSARLDAAQRRIDELERELQIKSREWSA